MRRQILAQLHESHQGTVRTKQRARLSVYWPGIDNDIDNVILACQTCQDSLPSNVKEPLIQKSRPDRPFQEIAIDFCSYASRDYLIIVDCCTDWPAIISMDRGTADHSPTSILLSYWHPRDYMVRWRTPVYLQSVSGVCKTVGILTQSFNTTLSTK